jgi:hypothetical protein
MGIRPQKCVDRWFLCRANVKECTYTNIDSIAYYTPSLYGIAHCSYAIYPHFMSNALHASGKYFCQPASCCTFWCLHWTQHNQWKVLLWARFSSCEENGHSVSMRGVWNKHWKSECFSPHVLLIVLCVFFLGTKTYSESVPKTSHIMRHVIYINVIGKAIPLQALTGPEGSRRLRLPDFKTISTWRWQGCQPYAPAAFIPRKYPWYSFLLEVEGTGVHVYRIWLHEL